MRMTIDRPERHEQLTEQLPDEHIPGIYLPSTFILIWLKSEGNRGR